MEESWILQLFDAIIDGKEQLVPKSGEEKIEVPLTSVKSIKDVKVNLKVEDLKEILMNLQVELNSDILNNVMSFLSKYTHQEKLPTEIQAGEMDHLRERIIQQENRIKELQEELEILRESDEYSDDERMQIKLSEDLDLLEEYCYGEQGNWKDFQNKLKDVFKDHMNFLEIPRTWSKEKVLKSANYDLKRQIEIDSNKESGTVDIHLQTRNAKKTFTLHIEAKSSTGKAKIDARRFIEHNEDVNADFGVVIGPKFPPADMYSLLNSCKEKKEKREFHYSIITIQALKEIVMFVQTNKLTQDFLIELLRLDSLLCSEYEVTDVVDSISRAKHSNLRDYFNKKFIIPKEELDIDEERILGIEKYCEDLYNKQRSKYVFKEIIDSIQKRWESRSLREKRKKELPYEKFDYEISKMLEKRRGETPSEEDPMKFLIFLSIFELIDFKPSPRSDIIEKMLSSLKTRVHVDKRQDNYFKDKMKYYLQFF
ncbi:MAG: hypothetical protein ACXADY_22010 [Candidatus Hodarchaeales archaeon]|jgi:hypothetical protein